MGRKKTQRMDGTELKRVHTTTVVRTLIKRNAKTVGPRGHTDVSGVHSRRPRTETTSTLGIQELHFRVSMFVDMCRKGV